MTFHRLARLRTARGGGVRRDQRAQGRVPGRDDNPSPAGDTTTTNQ